jgi:hypothetical protein
MRRTYAVAIALVLATCAVPTALAGAPSAPATLTGEQLTGTTPQALRASCDTTGSSTIAFTVSGVATGPYPGTFSAAVVMRIGPQTGAAAALGLRGGSIASYREAFQIQSPNGTVVGTKTLLADVGNLGQCREFNGEQPADYPIPGVNLNGYLYGAVAQLSYEAVVQQGRGRAAVDRGTSRATFSDSRVTCCPNESDHDLVTLSATGAFVEEFTSGPATQPDTRPGRGCGDDNHQHERRDECDD